VSNSWTSNATPIATVLLPTLRVARVARGSHCSQSGNMILVSLSSLQLPRHPWSESSWNFRSRERKFHTMVLSLPGAKVLRSESSCYPPPQRTTGCWCCESSHPPRHVACITVQLITVSKCPVSPSLYSRRLRPEPSQPSDRDQACTWPHVIAAYTRRSDRDRMLIEASPTHYIFHPSTIWVRPLCREIGPKNSPKCRFCHEANEYMSP